MKRFVDFQQRGNTARHVAVWGMEQGVRQVGIFRIQEIIKSTFVSLRGRRYNNDVDETSGEVVSYVT